MHFALFVKHDALDSVPNAKNTLDKWGECVTMKVRRESVGGVAEPAMADSG